MLINEWLKTASAKLDEVDISTSKLDALILLEDLSHKDRGWLLAHPEFDLPDKLVLQINRQIERRTLHEPLAYIRGKTEFYGREFIINSDVLEPRPETETMIENFKALNMPEHSRILDVGTGSGAIGITIKLERPDCVVDLTDIDEKCLQVADKNLRKYKLELKLLRLDLLTHAKGPYNVILANLPYVPDEHTINKAAMREPKIAIFGGPDGLDVYRRMFTQLKPLYWQPKFILTESLPPQHAELSAIAKKAGYKVRTTQDFIQVFEA